MTSMIEKMAHAIDPSIWKHFDDYVHLKAYDEQDQAELKQKSGPLADSLAAARAALQPFLDPTDGVIKAGGEKLYEVNSDWYRKTEGAMQDAELCLAAMIQAAIDGK